MYDANGILMANYSNAYNGTAVTASKLTELHMYGSGRVGVYEDGTTLNLSTSGTTQTNDMHKQMLEISDHLGSVRAVVTGVKTGPNATIVSLSDYHEFGMVMQGRKFVSTDYRFGYQGSEKETSAGAGGNAGWQYYTTEFRMLDSRLGRWFTPDPIVHPWQSPYVSMNNNPISLIDPFGADADEPPDGGFSSGAGSSDCPVEMDEIVITPQSGMGENSCAIGENANQEPVDGGPTMFNFGAGGVFGQSQAPLDVLMKAVAVTNYYGAKASYQFKSSTTDGKTVYEIAAIDEVSGTGIDMIYRDGQWSYTQHIPATVLGTIDGYTYSFDGQNVSGTGVPAFLTPNSDYVAKSNESSADETLDASRLIPIYGSGMDAYDAFSEGSWGMGIVHTALAISDVFLVKAAVTAIVKAGVKTAAVTIIKEVAEEGVKKGGRMTADQIALKELVDEATLGGRKALKESETKIIIEWADEVKYPGFRASPADMAPIDNHWIGGPHIHIPGVGNGHIPIGPF